jgi:hypothetical protein
VLSELDQTQPAESLVLLMTIKWMFTALNQWGSVKNPGKNASFVIWLVVSTPLKNIIQLGLLFPKYVFLSSKQPTSNSCLMGIP